jgi:hypothetical protein
MTTNARFFRFFCLATFLIALPAFADTIYLDANFDDKTLDMPIGTGGPTVGEPVYVDSSITAIVRGTPMPTPCLELQDNDDYSAGFARFEFLGSVELTTGEVGISAMLWFTALSPGYDFKIYVREQGSSAQSFANVQFHSSGNVYSDDANSNNGAIGTYATGRVFPFGIKFDMDAGTYDIWLDGNLVLEGETHGIVGHGVGAVLFGCTHDPDLDGHFFVDDILVANYLPATDAEPAAWGQVKALYR